jgi:hypothetical protein
MLRILQESEEIVLTESQRTTSPYFNISIHAPKSLHDCRKSSVHGHAINAKKPMIAAFATAWKLVVLDNCQKATI